MRRRLSDFQSVATMAGSRRVLAPPEIVQELRRRIHASYN